MKLLAVLLKVDSRLFFYDPAISSFRALKVSGSGEKGLVFMLVFWRDALKWEVREALKLSHFYPTTWLCYDTNVDCILVVMGVTETPAVIHLFSFPNKPSPYPLLLITTLSR